MCGRITDFPLKVEYISTEALKSSMSIRTFVNNVSDDEFEIPAGVQVMDAGSFNIPGLGQ
jgi:hypothetical protein